MHYQELDFVRHASERTRNARGQGQLLLDVLACPRCGSRLPVIATVQDPPVVRTMILAHLARSGAPKAARPRSAALA